MRWRSAAGLGAVILLAVVLAALLAPLSGYDLVTDVDPGRAHLGLSLAHPLGTDHLGRDVRWRLVFASRAFAGPGLLAAAVAGLLGTLGGALGGYRGGPLAGSARYLYAVIGSIPRFVLVLLVGSVYGDSPWVLALVVGLSYAPALGEALHSRVASLRRAEFVRAGRAYGLSDARILWVHLVWYASRALIGRHLLAVFGYYVVLESTLAYIGGFGVQEPMPSWGNMLVFEWGRGQWLALLAPAAALWLVVSATRWLADALEDPLDV
ncbi:MAG: ABC transporter permease subunit [Deltaproteobacteria bacterium]|nr:ABC transporter permease subunit [Deltaproteobacteria bacterium]